MVKPSNLFNVFEKKVFEIMLPWLLDKDLSWNLVDMIKIVCTCLLSTYKLKSAVKTFVY